MTKVTRKEIGSDSKLRSLKTQARYFLRPSKALSLISAVERKLREDGHSAAERDTSGCKTSFTNMPEEMVVNILSYLSVRDLNRSVAPVCRKWYLYSRHPCLWRDLKFKEDSIPTSEVRRLLRQAPLLRNLEIIDRSDMIVLLEEVCHSNRRLERIVIKQSYNPVASRLSPYAINFSVNPSSFRWQSVESIFMDDSSFYLPVEMNDHSHIPASVLLKLLRSCRFLHTISLIGIETRSQIFFQKLALLPRLRSVDLTVGNRAGSMSWTVTFLKEHIGEGTRAVPLHLSAIYNWFNTEIEGNRTSHIHMLNSHQILQLITPTIVVLDLDAAYFNESMFEPLLKCFSLRALHLNNATSIISSILIRMLTELKHLTSLRINQAYRLRSSVLLSAINSSMNSKCNKNKNPPLKYLSMADCPAIDDASIHAIASHYPQLEHLSLPQCHRITDEGLRCALWFCHQLRSINLWDCSGLVGRSLMYIPKYAPNLHLLMIGTSTGQGFISRRRDKHIKALKEQMPDIIVHDGMIPPKGWTLTKNS